MVTISNFNFAGVSSGSAIYWKGQSGNGLWTTMNWASDSTGTATGTIPTTTSDVIFSAAGATNQNTTLGADFTIHSLTINDPVPVTIGGSNTLTISGASGTGVNVTNGSGLFVVNANLVLAGASNTITVSNAAGAVINGAVGGTIGLDKEGAGALTLTGVNTYTGTTTVGAGALFVDGSTVGNATVKPGALIGGHGTVGGSLVNGGIVSPGNSPGVLTINGNYTQSSTGALIIQIGGLEAFEHDLLKVRGAANLGGALFLVPLNNFHLKLGDKVTFLTAGGGITGAFDAIDNPFFTGTMIGARLVFNQDAISIEGVQNAFTSLPGETPNERAVSYALDHSYADPRNAKLIDHLDNEPLDKVISDLDRISPEELTSIYQIAVSQAKVQTANLQRRLEDVRSGSSGFSAAGLAMNNSSPTHSGSYEMVGPPGPDGKDGKAVFTPAPDNRWGIFITGTGEWANTGDTSNARGYDLTNAGFTLGIDYKLTDHFVVGLATGYDHSSADLTGSGRVIVDGGRLALYASYFTGKGFYSDFSVGGGYNSYDTHRSALLGSANGSDIGEELNVLFGTGYDWKIGGLTFGPTGNFEYNYVGIESFGEHGSLAPLAFPTQHQESIRSTFGGRLSYDWEIGNVVVKPELRAGWQHEYGDATLGIDSSFANGSGPEFLVHGPATGRDSLVLSAGFAVQWSPRCSSYVYYDGELARTNYQANAISGGFRFDY